MHTPVPYPNPAVREAWLDRLHEDAIDPDVPIIDPHHHFFDQHGMHATQPYLLDALSADFHSGHNIVGRVYVQAGWRTHSDGPPALRPAGETAAAAALAASAAPGAGAAMPTAIVSYADLRDPALEQVLDAHAAAGKGLFRGIRQSAALDADIQPMTTVVPPAGLLRDPAFQRGLRLLGTRGLRYDAWQYHPQLGDLLLAARAAPDTTVIIDHLGGPLRCGGYRAREQVVHAEWLAAMQALARCPNVHVKLGGLGMTINGFDYHQAAAPASSQRMAADWEPWVHPCIEAFGAERCMFESNFPVDKGMFSYKVLWNAFKRLAQGASATQTQALFHGTAQRVYRPGIAS